MSTHPAITALAASKEFSNIDQVLAATLIRRAGLDGDVAAAVTLATACLSRARGDGHSALDLSTLATEATKLGVTEDAASWQEQLQGNEVVGDGNSLTPLVLDGGMLQFRRYRDAEQRIAARIRGWLAAGGDRFRIITGGPGTGKTTTVARMLVETVERDPGKRIALAAPTGKAAARMSESIRQRLDALGASPEVRVRVPQDASTLHRLLGYWPSQDRYSKREGDHIAADLVIVDEASMVDVLMMDALFKALGPNTDLLLVGDHNQLASVDAGDVLGALCRAGEQRPEGDPMRRSITRLDHSYRFAAHPGIGAMADALLAGDGDRTVMLLQDPEQPDVSWIQPTGGSGGLLRELEPHLERCLAATSPQELLAALEGFRVLAPEREGTLGVTGINAAVERWLARRGASASKEWYHRRPVLVTANDYVTNLFNGDLGVVWDSGSEVLVHFPEAQGATRAVSPSRLPAVQTAWAMTVHKAQGSEFDDVIVALPAHESRVLGRELLYTAVTRARRRVTVFADEAAIRAGVAKSAQRQSGLARWLEGGSPP